MIGFDDLIWQCDYLGSEVGYPEVETVGVYNLETRSGTYEFLIDTSDNEVLAINPMDQEE